MFEMLFEKTPALIIPVIALLGVTLVFAIWLVAHYWGSVRRLEVEAALKQDMLNRGMPVADIERLIIATSGYEPGSRPPAPAETITDNEYYLVEKMLDEGHSIEDIERLVRAFKGGDSSIQVMKKNLEV